MKCTEKIIHEEFLKRHPSVKQLGVTSLYRFYSISKNNEFIERLLKDGKLYLASPIQLNDPFECKPHYSWPNSAQKAKKVRDYLIRMGRQGGISKKMSEKIISESMRKEGYIESVVLEAMKAAFGNIRLCSFTESKDNLLLWSHYSNSHTGICLEFDATTRPVINAHKIYYDDEYPEVYFPINNGAEMAEPVLVKSRSWEYENEFRLFYNKGSELMPENDGESLILKGHEIQNVYFGSNISSKNKSRVLQAIEEGPFQPGLWQARTSRSSYSLIFECIG